MTRKSRKFAAATIIQNTLIWTAGATSSAAVAAAAAAIAGPAA